MTRELLLFVKSFWYGASLLLLYDILRIFRKAFRHGKILTATEDIIYWVFCAVYLFSKFYQENSGILRAYLFAGVLLGVFACSASISTPFVKCGAWLLNGCKKILGIPLKGVKKIIKRLKNQLFRFKIYVNNSRGEKKEEGSLHPSQKPRPENAPPEESMKKEKSRNSRRAMKAHQNKVTMIGITFVVCVLMVTLLVQGQKLNAKLSSNQQRTS